MAYISLYKRLGIEPNASQAQILEAYRNLVKHMHPDKLPAPRTTTGIAAAVSFKKIYIAYEVLSSLSARAAYDRGGMTEVCRIEGAMWWLTHCEAIARQLPPLDAPNNESRYQYKHDQENYRVKDYYEPEPRHCTCLMESVPVRNTILKFGPIPSLVTYTCEMCRQAAAEEYRRLMCRHKLRRIEQWVEKTLEYLYNVQYYEECDPLPPLPESENTIVNNQNRAPNGSDVSLTRKSIGQQETDQFISRPERDVAERQWYWFFSRKNNKKN